MEPRMVYYSIFTALIGASGAVPGEPEPSPDLRERCRKILQMQTAVCAGTADRWKLNEGNTDRQTRPEDSQASRVLYGRQKAIAAELSTVIEMLETQGSAIAAAAALRDLRDEMLRVQDLLAHGDVGAETQALQRGIVETLADVVEALAPK
jgi:hypothetical protein